MWSTYELWYTNHIHKNCLASLLKMNILWLWPKPTDTKSMDRNSNSLFSTSFSACFMHTNVWKKYFVGKEKKRLSKKYNKHRMLHHNFSHSLSCAWHSVTPKMAICQAYLSFAVSWSLLKLMSTESMMLGNC